MDATTLALFLLADGRFPAGGHAHSFGVESAVRSRRITGEPSLEEFVRARMRTVGLVEAAIAAATTHRLASVGSPAAATDVLRALDDEADARIVAVPLRAASRRLGRQLARAAARCWPASEFAQLAGDFPDGAHQSVVLGCVGVAIGAAPRDIAAIALHHTITTPVQAGVRMLGLDPFAAAAIVARLASEAAELAAVAETAAPGPLSELPAGSLPLLDIAAAEHATWESRLFAT